MEQKDSTKRPDYRANPEYYYLHAAHFFGASPINSSIQVGDKFQNYQLDNH